jgi:RNA polymerase sigma-70 factor (ECF subfamily)
VPLTKSELESVYLDWEVQLYNVALRWVFNPALAEDVVHEAFIRVWNRRDDVDPTTVKGLLFKTAQNLAINESRKRRVREAVPVIGWLWPEPSETDTDLIQRQELARMRDMMDRLPHDLREVLVLSQFSDLSYEEIARATGVPEGTVASRKSRALRMLREWMDGDKNELV